MVQYLTPEWLEAVKKEAAAAAPSLEKEFKGITTSLKNVVKGAPGGETRVVLFRFANGELTEARLGDEATLGPEKAEFTMIGSYDVFVRVNRGELDSKAAIMKRDLKLDGNILKALRLSKPFETFNGVVRKVPTEY